MQLPLERETLASTPSFRKIGPEEWPVLEESSPQEISAFGSFHGIHEALDRVEGDDGEGDDDGSEDFEFAVLSRDSFEGLDPISADDIFSNGRILPVYPLFNRALAVDDAGFQHQEGENQRSTAGQVAEKPARLPLRKLMMEDREPPLTSTSSSAATAAESDELNGVPTESYCLWTPGSVPPSPEMRRRSQSTGDCSSASKRWRLRDLVIGRSQSDGRKKFFLLAPPPPQPFSAEAPAEKTRRRSSADGAPVAPAAAAQDEKKGKGKGKGGVRVLEMDIVMAHRLYYGKGGAAAEDRRRSYLPYRKDLVGLFANVNGAGRRFQPHPF